MQMTQDTARSAENQNQVEKQKRTWQATGIKVVILTNFINVQQRQQVAAGRQANSLDDPILIRIGSPIFIRIHGRGSPNCEICRRFHPFIKRSALSSADRQQTLSALHDFA